MSSVEVGSDIAIIGMAVRVPGATTYGQFWRNLREGVMSIETRSVEELIAAGESPRQLRRKNYVPRAAVLPGMADFDAEFFGFSPKDAAILDPQHRQFLECAWEALEDAARPPESLSGPVGVFAGCGMGSYFYFNVCSHRPLVDQVGMFLLRHTGNDKDFLATRASYSFDLHGPSVNIQTACSTSLVAVHYAAQSLLNGECEMALAGGVTIELPHGRGYLYQEGEILSPDGHCRAFDHRSDGTVFGSGVGVVVLRRLSDAIADGDPIHAVIKATAVNNDGAGKASYLAPSVTGQAETVVEAHALAGVSADTIEYVECHGTGTAIGDPIEIAALTQAFRLGSNRNEYCRIGSVKTNIGHLDTAAGVVSLIKSVLAIEHGEMPPSLGYEKPNPAIDFANSPFVVNERLTPWPRGRGPRRAGVNSLGVGGTNAHAIVEEAPARVGTARKSAEPPQLIMLSARSRKALDETGKRLAAHLEENPDIALADVAYTLAKGRRSFDHRRVLAVASREDAISILNEPASRRSHTHTEIQGLHSAVLLFPGGGAQYPGMARQLYENEPPFAKCVDQGIGFLPAELAVRIRSLWIDAAQTDTSAASELLRPSLQLPAIFILEVALARLWESIGLKPAALIGHSMGEYAAACVAGVMSFERAINLVRLRGELFDKIEGGGMLSVPIAVDALRRRLPSSLDVAVVNAPELCVVSGPDAELEAFRKTLVADGIDATRVPINIAAHSRMLEPILGRFEEFLRETPLSPPQIPIVSNLTGTWMTAAEATDPMYWVRHLRSTVRFADGLATLAAGGARVYIEAGPGRTLSSLAKAQGSIDGNAVINSLPHADEMADDRLYFMTAVGRASVTGLDMAIDRFWQGEKPRRINLPTYCFQHQRYFLEPVAATADSAGVEAPPKREDLATWGWKPVWKPVYANTIPGIDRDPSSFLIFMDDTGLGTGLARRLRSAGHRVVTVSLGDTFAAGESGDCILCPELGRDGYDALLRHLHSSGGVPNHIVHLWLFTGDEHHRPGSSFFHRNQERGFYSLFHMAQALGGADVEDARELQITVLTNGMQRVGQERLPYPEKATVLGPAQVIPREFPGVSVKVLDVPADLSSDRQLLRMGKKRVFDLVQHSVGARPELSIADLIWEDLFADHSNELVAFRDGRRYVQTLAKQPLPECVDGASGLRPGGVYLLTGGLGDIATAIATDLGRRFSARLALLGRIDLPERSSWPAVVASQGSNSKVARAIAAIQSIESAGGEVHYVRADLTNPEAVQRAIAETKARFGALNGVIHTAGVVNDNLILLKSISDLEDVLAPKVLGTMVLAEALADEKLDVFALFSSTSTDTAPAGQVDYVAANAYLNAFAASRAGSSTTQTVAIHWGVWNKIGIAARAIGQSETHAVAESESADAPTEPLFETRWHDAVRGDRLELTCGPKRQWLLDEHRLRSGEAVWPGTGYIELVAEAARAFGISGPMEISNLAFLRPFHIPDGQTRTLAVRAEPSTGGLRLAIESLVDFNGDPAWLRHAEALATPLRAAPSAPLPAVDLEAALARCPVKSIAPPGVALRPAQDRHLRLGPRWQVLQQLHVGSTVAVAKLELADMFTCDLDAGLMVHPALMDIATGCAMDLIAGYDAAEGLWVPASYGSIRLHESLPATIWSHVTRKSDDDPGPGYATFDVIVTNAEGRVLLEVEGFTVKQLAANSDFSAALTDTTAAVPLARKPLHTSRDLSPALLRLAEQVENGIAPSEGGDAFIRAIATRLPQVVVSSMDIAALQKLAATSNEVRPASGGTARPELNVEFSAPTSDVEKTLAGFWSELLGIEKIGVTDSFFDLGGHSLIAVRLFRLINKTFAIDLPISVLFEAPTIADCARMIEAAGGSKALDAVGGSTGGQPQASVISYTHIVRMHAGRHPDATPLLVCAGMFGNILNLRHLALQIGEDRPVYGLQARGLYGDCAPHETFEDMARANIAEVRAIQPHGPYLLSGFSGGGLVAYEMAQQLRAAGETVSIVVLLDTPYPEDVQLSIADRAAMKLQELVRDKGAFVMNWARRRIAWEMQRLRKSRKDEETESAEHFHNDAIEAAFRRALSKYCAEPCDSPVVLLRPKLQIAYTLRDGRKLNAERSILKPDNGWTSYCPRLTIREAPGDHDSMVLEPNVRVLASYMREALNAAVKLGGKPEAKVVGTMSA
ncbi:MAG: type I polyketide synthase [Hyphomicrobium sp.]